MGGARRRRLLIMKRAMIQTFVVLVTLASGTFAQGVPPLPPPPEQDPFVGTWRANRDKSRPKLDDTDASYVRTIGREGDEIVLFSRITLFERHKVVEHHYRYRCDGKPYRLPHGSLSCLYKGANLIESEASSPDGKYYLTSEVSADGQEVRILTYKNKTRTKLKSVWVMDRVH
jgi:hypothetical protein